MFGFSRRLIALVIITGGLKVLAATLVPLYSPRDWGGDFFNWVTGARAVLITLGTGRLPSIADGGIYVGLDILLAPFFWLWTSLPIPHPSLAEMAAAPSTAEYLLVLIMKTPILLCDLFTGILAALLVRRATGSDRAAQKAFLAWYLNPYNSFWMYYYGGFDVIPTSVLLLAILFGNSKQWFRSGFCLAIAGLLRLFPFLLLPFFVVYSLRDSYRSSVKLLASFLVPIICAFVSQLYVIGSFDAVMVTIVKIPLTQPWILNYYGFSITPGLSLLAPFLLAVQFYLVSRYWKKEFAYSLAHFSLAALLVLFAGSHHYPYHFVWVSPLLGAYYALERDGLQLFVLTFIFASFYTLGFYPDEPLYSLQPVIAGVFYGFKAVYLVKLNLGAIKSRVRGVCSGSVSGHLHLAH